MDSSSRFRAVRDNLGLTQRELGEALGFTWHKIKDIEAGKLKVTPEIAEAIEKIYSIGGWWLLTGKGQMLLESQSVPSVELSHHIADKEMEVVVAFRELSAEKQELYYHKLKAEAIEERLKKEDHQDQDVRYA